MPALTTPKIAFATFRFTSIAYRARASSLPHLRFPTITASPIPDLALPLLPFRAHLASTPPPPQPTFLRFSPLLSPLLVFSPSPSSAGPSCAPYEATRLLPSEPVLASTFPAHALPVIDRAATYLLL